MAETPFYGREGWTANGGSEGKALERSRGLSDILTPIGSRACFRSPKTPIENRVLYSDKAKEEIYYAFPLKQPAMHVQIGKGHAGAIRLVKEKGDIRPPGRNTGVSGANKVQPGYRKAGEAARPRLRPSGHKPDGGGYRPTRSSCRSLTFGTPTKRQGLVDDDGKLLT